MSQIRSQLAKEFHPRRLLPSLTAGFVSGIILVIVEISFAALIFSGELSEHVSRGIGFTLFGTFLISVVGALTSSFSGTVSAVQDAPAVILALVAATIVRGMPVSASSEETFNSVVAAIVMTSLLTGLFFFLLGRFRLGGLVRYVPYPVVGGFLAGTGWLLVKGAVGMMTDMNVGLSQLGALFRPDIWARWVPGVIFAVLLLVILRRYSHFLIIPTMLFAAIGLFYLVFGLVTGSLAEASAQGWLLGPFPEGGLWKPLTLAAWGQVDFSLVFGQLGMVGTILVISVISLLLNASGLELIAGQDIHLNRELKSVGLANLLAGLGGSPVGYASLSLSALGHRMGTTSRLVGLFSALVCGLMLFFGAPILSFFPKVVVGGLLFFLGLSFLVEWIYDAWFKIPKAEYGIVLLISLIISMVGVLEGVGVGLVLMLLLFIVNYSRTGIVKHEFSGANYHSVVSRPRLYRQLLREKGHWLYILELEGFIFFGTANRLLEKVQQRIDNPDLLPPKFILFDFRQVSGLDASAAFSFSRAKERAKAKDIVLVFTHLSAGLRRQLEAELFQGDEDCRIFVDMDHGVEWCEEQMLRDLQSVGFSATPRSAKRQLESFLPKSDKLMSLFEYWEQEDEGPRETDEEPVSVALLAEYLRRIEVEAGTTIIRQGEPVDALYFVETGQVTVQLEYEDGRTVRLQRVEAGTVVGELDLYLGSPAAASVVADQDCTIYALASQELKRMERDDAGMAAAFHKFVAQLLSERLTRSNATLQALLM